MVKRCVLVAAWCLVAVTGHAQTFRSFILNDTSNTASSAWSPALLSGDLLVGYAGTQLTGGQISGPFTAGSGGVTMSDGTVANVCGLTGCDFTGVSSMNTRVWTGTTQAGTPTIQFNTSIPSSTIGGVGMELTAVNSVDQIDTKGFTAVTSPATTTITSNSITTTHANEILLCLGQEANPIAAGNHFVSVSGGGWTGVAFGNQAISWLVEPTSGTAHSCTINLGASGTEDYALTVVSFYQATAAFQPDEDYFLQFTVGLIVAMVYAMSGTKKTQPARLLLADPTFRFIRAIPRKQQVRLLQP